MNRIGHNGVNFFVGSEVEHTPAFSKRTLFVVGKQDVSEIIAQARIHHVQHVFMGANHSFDSSDTDTYWDSSITDLLNRGFWVTLDYQAHQHREVLGMLSKKIWASRTFVPLLSVRIPYVESSSINLTIKVDDIDFNETNPGVWCASWRDLTDNNKFTDWKEYESDQITGNTVTDSPFVIIPEDTILPVTGQVETISEPPREETQTVASTTEESVSLTTEKSNEVADLPIPESDPEIDPNSEVKEETSTETVSETLSEEGDMPGDTTTLKVTPEKKTKKK